MKLLQLLSLGSILGLLVSGCASSGNQVSLIPDHDLVLVASPIIVKPIYPGATFNAFEGQSSSSLSAMRSVVQLRVEDVLKGEYQIIKVGGPSKVQQLKDALENKEMLKVLTLDIQDPDEQKMKEWITVAVVDPFVTFGITDWDDPENDKHKLYLRSVEGEQDRYYLVHVRNY